MTICINKYKGDICMQDKDCSRKKVLLQELYKDWDKLNLAFKSLIIIGIVLLISVIIIAFFSDGGSGSKNSIEVVFRSTLASVFGFLLSSNIKTNRSYSNHDIEHIQEELDKIQGELKELQINEDVCQVQENDNCEKERKEYGFEEGNLVQIAIALTVCLVSIVTIGIIFLTNNIQNVPAISQIRDLMCSSIGFLLGESSKKG